MDRRSFIKLSSAGVLGLSMSPQLQSQTAKRITVEKYLRSILYNQEEVDAWLSGKAFPFARYSSEFGWLLPDAYFKDGVDDSISHYRYERNDGPRLRINYADQPCRINTYGDSFTQCHQVSDGETWQEVLAAHLQEPVRNFGIGGWSVYQAYLRMLKEEERTPSDVIIFNIYNDDHFRNLDSWRNIRVNKHERFIEPTLPHLVVNPSTGLFREKPNPCPTEASVKNLCDYDWVYEHFKDDFALGIEIAHQNAKTQNPRANFKELMDLATTHGILTRADNYPTLEAAAEALHEEAAYFSTMRLVEKIDAYAAEHDKKLLYILSYPADHIAEAVENGRRDKVFVDFIKGRRNPVIDLLEAHEQDHRENYKISFRDYLKQFFVGHYNPRGNFFCAFAAKNSLVDLLDPKPMAYRQNSGIMK
ncbi:MAG: hypothetical protein KJT03_12320 [Verrucomicrobiae bacterium]|nr:hypothetical protein [Verrucomicrobiae bacterium]